MFKFETKSKTNKLSKHILESKYFNPDFGEKTPEDLFLRVAMVAAIPDVIDHFVPMGREKILLNAFPSMFGRYEKLAERVITRRGIKIVSPRNYTIAQEKVITLPDIKKVWKKETEKYYEAFCNLEFMPGTPTLINIGKENGMLSNCFFLRIPDSMEGIFETVKNTARVFKLGGGIGLDISDLRPEGALVKGTRGVSSGPISFLRVFDVTGQQVQGGGIRRAAMLAGMHITHPDIVKFIKCKEIEGELSNLNISVFVSDKFMEKLNIDLNIDKPWFCHWGNSSYVISKATDIPTNIDEMKKMDCYTAKDIWDLIIRHVWKNGEPGIIFDDTVNQDDPFNEKFGKLGMNACSEIPLLNAESCNLAAINLATCIKPNSNLVDYEKIKYLTKLGVRFLDNIIDLNYYPLPEIEKITLIARKMGLGTMGLHDLMLHQKIKYGSTQSLTLIDLIYETIKETANQTSTELGKLRGIPEELEKIDLNRRNSGLLSVQPTGSVSIICNQVSSAIEPVFQWEYTRKDSFGEHKLRHPILKEYPDQLPEFAVTALEIPPEQHVAVQARVQKYIDLSISKTINAPNTATKEDIANAFQLAHKLGCKSTTAYRSGSRQEEVLVKNSEKQIEKEPKSKLRTRPRILPGATYRINTPGGKAYITVNEDKEGIREVFVHISKAGSEIATRDEAEGRLISNSLKNRIPVTDIIKHMIGHKSNPIFDTGRLVKSVPDAIAQVMQDFRDNIEGFSGSLEILERPKDKDKQAIKSTNEISGDLCPECGEMLYGGTKCDTCISCGFSQCG